MSNFKGTKGKWFFVKNDYYNEIISENNHYDNSGKRMRISTLIHEIQEDGRVVSCNFSEEDNANDKIIECAPEMLEMLEYFVNNNMLSITGEEKAKQLIKKATE